MADELKGKTILIVDDDREVVQSIKAALADTGATIDAAADGNVGADKAIQDSPDLMILDMMLPKRSGFLVLERLRKDRDKTAPPQVIFITGNLGRRHRECAEALGVAAYMTKPFRMDRLIETITDLLS